jgi:uncharacterized protein
MNNQPLTDADLDRLAALIPYAEDGPLPLDAIQGLLCAVVSAPQVVMPSRWLPVAVGKEHEYATAEEAREVTELLMRFHNDVARELNAGEGLDLVLFDTKDGGDTLSIWCEGYLMGVSLANPPWDEVADKEDLEEMLGPFFLLSGRAKEGALADGDPWMTEEEERRAMAECAEALVDRILDNRAYWLSKSYPDTFRRTAPKVGRNEPCPCGSGKKFKSCHGR